MSFPASAWQLSVRNGKSHEPQQTKLFARLFTKPSPAPPLTRSSRNQRPASLGKEMTHNKSEGYSGNNPGVLHIQRAGSSCAEPQHKQREVLKLFGILQGLVRSRGALPLITWRESEARGNGREMSSGCQSVSEAGQ